MTFLGVRSAAGFLVFFPPFSLRDRDVSAVTDCGISATSGHRGARLAQHLLHAQPPHGVILAAIRSTRCSPHGRTRNHPLVGEGSAIGITTVIVHS
jgi:hypothetical protein